MRTCITTTVAKWHWHTGQLRVWSQKDVHSNDARQGLQHRDRTFTIHFSLAAAVCQDVSTNWEGKGIFSYLYKEMQ